MLESKIRRGCRIMYGMIFRAKIASCVCYNREIKCCVPIIFVDKGGHIDVMPTFKEINMKNFLICLMLIVLTACTRTATLVNFETGEVLKATFTDGPGTNGNVEIVMPDGEVLQGQYTGMRGNESISFTNATASAYGYDSSGSSATALGTGAAQSYSVGGQGKAYGLLTSTKPGSKLVMEIIAVYGVLSGHGHGEARTNDGRKYKLQF